jgi:hypothetical protein
MLIIYREKRCRLWDQKPILHADYPAAVAFEVLYLLIYCSLLYNATILVSIQILSFPRSDSTPNKTYCDTWEISGDGEADEDDDNVLLGLAPCRVADKCHRFGETCCLYFQGVLETEIVFLSETLAYIYEFVRRQNPEKQCIVKCVRKQLGLFEQQRRLVQR